MNFGLPALFVGISSTSIGLGFLIVALDRINQSTPIKIPPALYTLAAAVILDLALLGCMWAPIISSIEICWLILGASFVFLVATTVLVGKKNSGPGIGAIRMGSRVLLGIAVFGWLLIAWASTN